MPYRHLYIIQRLPLALVVCSFIGGLVGAALSFFGIGVKKLELSCGVGTAVVATALSLFVLKFDWDASVIVEQQFAVFKEMSLVLVLFMLPGGMVAVGSYAHAARRRAWGR